MRRRKAPIGTDPDGSTISYTYDAAGNRATVATVAGTTNYTYDALNRLETVTDPEGGLTTYSYDATSHLVRTELPNGGVESRQYDKLGRLVLLAHATSSGHLWASYRYTIDATGRRTAVEEHDGRRVEYAYDELYRLVGERIFDTGATDPSHTIDYAYNAVGNRLVRDDSLEGRTTYGYDANDRLLTENLAADVTRYEYDNNGNQCRRIDVATDQVLSQWEWDYESRLVGADTDGDGTTDVQYQYDATGNRVAKIVGGEETRFLVDSNRSFSQVLMEYTPAGVMAVSYVHGQDLISQNRDGVKSFYHVDGLGSTRALTNTLGVVTDRYRYDAFGRVLSQFGTAVNRHLFTGEQFDPLLGQYYLRARHYDPASGRFTAMDPFPGLQEIPRSLHKYLYTGADPVNNVDFSGQISTGTLIGVMIATAILSGLVTGATMYYFQGGQAMYPGVQPLSLSQHIKIRLTLPLVATAARHYLAFGWATVEQGWFNSPSLAVQTIIDDYWRDIWELANGDLDRLQFRHGAQQVCVGRDANAYVYPDDAEKIVYLCEPFWKEPRVSGGGYSWVTTLVHELSHIADYRNMFGTEDHKQGRQASLELAKSDPHKAAWNAANYAFAAADLGF